MTTAEFTCVVPEGWECAFTNTANEGVAVLFFFGLIIFLIIALMVFLWRS